MRTAVAVLIAVGIGAAIARALFPSDLVQHMEPARAAILDSLSITDPHAAERPAEAVRFDSRLGQHHVLTRVHVLGGALFLGLAPLQFWSRLRARHPTLHRWSGRLLVADAFASTGASLYFALAVPFGGAAETIAILTFGCVFLFSLARAVVAIRRRQVARHREWMIRAFAVAVGISTVRLVGMVLDPPLTLLGFTAVQVFVVSVWTGWVLTLAAAEGWIRSTRPAPAAVAAAA